MDKLSHLSRNQLSEEEDVINSSFLDQSYNYNEIKEKEASVSKQKGIKTNEGQIKQKLSNDSSANKHLSKNTLASHPIQIKEKKTRYDYLYEHSKILLAKRKQIQNAKLKWEYSQMNPIITAKAKRIQRNPGLFAERLYPGLRSINKKIMVEEEEEVIEEKDLYGDQKEKYQRIYHKQISPNNDLKSPYSFRPTFNQHSLSMASKLPMNSMTRLTIPKYRTPPIQDCNNNNNINNSKSQLSARTRTCLTPNPRLIDLYNKAMQAKKKKKEIIQFIHSQREKEETSFPFKPELNTHKPYTSRYNNQPSPNTSHIKNNFNSNKQNVYYRNYKWKENIDQETERIKKQKADNETIHCTFKPIINKRVMNTSNDIKLMQHISSQNLFVKRRRHCLKQQKEDEALKKKKFFIQEYNSKDNQSRSYSRNTMKRNFIKDTSSISKGEKITLDSSINQNEAIGNKIKTQRNQLGLLEYFSGKNDFEQESINYFKYCYNHNDHIGNKNCIQSKIGTNNHSIAFSEAVQKILFCN